MYPLIKRLDQALVSKHTAKLLKHSAEFLKAYKKTKSSAECLVFEKLGRVIVYNITHAVPATVLLGFNLTYNKNDFEI